MANGSPAETQPANEPQGGAAKESVNRVSEAEALLKEDYQREQQEAERRRRIEEARRTVAQHRQEVINSDPQLSASNKTIKNYSLVAAGTALVTPLVLSPIISVAGVAGVQLKMLADLAKIFGVPFVEERGKAFIASLASVGTNAVATPTVAGLLRIVPVVGGLMSKLSSSGVAFGSTYAVGKVFQSHFASGGTLLNFDPVKSREMYRAAFGQGTRMAPSSTPA